MRLFKRHSLNIILSFFFLSLLVSLGETGQKTNPHTRKKDYCVTVETEDQSVRSRACRPLRVTDGALTDNGSYFSLSTGAETASDLPITDAEGYYVATEVETALEEAREYTDSVIGVGLNYWFQASNVLGGEYSSAPAERTELVNADPDTLSNIYYKSTVANTPTPFVLTDGAEPFVHFQAAVDTTIAGKTVTLQTELWYTDADGTSNPVQVGATSSATGNLTTSQAFYHCYIIVATETVVPAGKRLWIKFIANPSTLTGYSPTVSIWDGDIHDHLVIPVSGSILGRFLQIDGTVPMTGALETSHGSILSSASGILTLGGTGGTNNNSIVLDFESSATQNILTQDVGVLRMDIQEVLFPDLRTYTFGDGADFRMRYQTIGNDNMQMGTRTSTGSYLSLMERVDMGNANRSPSAASVFGATSANPVFAFYSSDATQAGDMGGLTHDQINTRFRGGNGGIIIDSLANNDILLIDPDGSGNVGIGSTTPDVNLDVEGSTGISIGEDVTAGTTNEEGILKLWSDGDNAFYTQVKTGVQTQNTVYTLPLDDGDNTEVLQTNGSGVLEWVANAGGGTSRLNVNLPIYSAKLTGAYVVFTPPTADACTAGAGIDAGDGNWRLLFDATTDECATWQFIMPNNYSSTPLLDIMFSMVSGEANEVEFEAAIMCVTPTADTADIGTASFSNVAVGTATTVSATAGESYLQTITLTDDSCAAGDVVFIVISTDADDAVNDDASGDRECIGVNLRYTGS